MSSLKKRLVSGSVACVLALAGVAVVAAPAYASSGKVNCSTSAVVGMWVDVSGGTSGWASLTNTADPMIKNWNYNTQNKTWKVNVGCGGTPQNWGQSISSNWSNRQGASTINCTDTGQTRVCLIG